MRVAPGGIEGSLGCAQREVDVTRGGVILQGVRRVDVVLDGTRNVVDVA
jgi:hypothetical protein